MTSMKTLRQRAEQMLKTSATDVAEMPPEEVQRLVHELQVHQMELEIQNEELRHAQCELAVSRDRYSDLYEFAPVGYLTLDTQGVIQTCNLTAASMLGLERRQLFGRPLAAFLCDGSQSVWYLHRRNVFLDTAKHVCDLQARTATDADSIWQVISRSVADDSGIGMQCQTAIVDVTEQSVAYDLLSKLNFDLKASLSERTHELARNAEQIRLLAEAVSHLGEGVIITGGELDGPGGNIVFANQAMCRISGYPVDELVGRSPRILQNAATSRDMLQHLRKELLAGHSCKVELVNLRKDGTSYDAELFITPLFRLDGSISNFVSIHRDITDRKRIEQDLRRNEERLSMAFRATNDAIWDCDLVAGTVWWNDAYESQFGRPPEADNWQWWIDHIHRDDRDRVFKSLRAFAAGEGGSERWTAEYRFQRVDGSYAFVIDCAVRACNANGKPERLLGALVDVSERRSLEQEVLDISAAEHRRICIDLHDGLGQELTGLSMVADALATSLSRRKAREVSTARKLEAGLKQALGQIRALARGMNPVDTDASGLMSSLSEMAGRVSDLYDVQCVFVCDPPVLLTNNQTATQLFRIAQEAATNSVKHGKARQIVILLKRTEEEVTLRIVDDGIGMCNAPERETGAGLKIMGYRAGLAGGQLRISTTPSGGTKVDCTIPRTSQRN